MLLVDEAGGAHVADIYRVDLAPSEVGILHGLGPGLYAEGPEGFPPEFSELGASCSDYSYIPHVHSSGILIVFLYFA